MIYAQLFSKIPIGTKFVERFKDGSRLTYLKTSAGKAQLVDIHSDNYALRHLHKLGVIRRISHNNAFPLLADVLDELPDPITEATN